MNNNDMGFCGKKLRVKLNKDNQFQVKTEASKSNKCRKVKREPKPCEKAKLTKRQRG